MNPKIFCLLVLFCLGIETTLGDAQYFGHYDIGRRNSPPLHLEPVYDSEVHYSPSYHYVPVQQPYHYGDHEQHDTTDFCCIKISGPLKAIATMKGDGVSGNITLEQKSCTDNLQVHVSVVGLKPGKHAIHVHEKGDISGGCGSSGSHYNPEKQNHGDIDAQVRHVGDWSNIVAKEDGSVDTSFTDKLSSLHGPHSILARTIVIHADEDDLGLTDHPDSKKTGNAGGRVACGVIGIM